MYIVIQYIILIKTKKSMKLAVNEFLFVCLAKLKSRFTHYSVLNPPLLFWTVLEGNRPQHSLTGHHQGRESLQTNQQNSIWSPF